MSDTAATRPTQPETDPGAPGAPTLEERARVALRGVTRWLGGRMPRTPEEELRDLADIVAGLGDAGEWDRYGGRGPVEELERRLAELLGKPSAVFFPSGIMAQQSMLRVWCDERGSRRVALPGLSHLLHHEADGPRLIHGFEFELLTDGPRVPQVADLDAIPGPLGAALLELPLRDGGFLLPTWDELVVFSEGCRARGVPLHLDGARLWESQPHLGHPLAEIAALADSVYVSFYKGLAGLAGAALVGPEEQLAQARTWRSRMGGTLFSLMPYAVAALRGLDAELPRMAGFHARAVELSERLAARGIRVHPATPHTNAFRVYVARDAEDLNERMVVAMEREHVALTPTWRSADVPGWARAEFQVGHSTMEWDLDEAVATFVRVFVD
ncbi:threonine aldolase [Intrasporangium oryzae NRRL B-24470]|uniref:Threonine aldolase n=1 Tax=Intrasporangium oryzae NRRL B-24470 TaxID=1386089 RepID=W9GB92_9MICO|nr:beta-eliminating lyase-related protein [Intrasporangium oryzae]EWT02083.1 threonine aldolase [Intrasporangium oryzae NRRL B-24470]